MLTRRTAQLALIGLAGGALALGVAAWAIGSGQAATWIWGIGTVPVAAGLLVSMIREVVAGRVGVDAIAFVSMSGAILLGETLAGIVVAVMYAGGNVLEDFAVGRAERELKSLVDRAPRVAHRLRGCRVGDVPIEQVAIGDVVLVRAGEIVPVDGVVASAGATLDEAALTGEPIPVSRRKGEAARSGAVNAGETFEMRAAATAGESTYAGIVRLVTAAQTAKSPFIRLADRYALLLLPVTLVIAGIAWFLSGDPIRGLAVLVAATPCPLILAAPVALIAGVSQAARRGILIKGGGPLEALARVRTAMFDKTGTLTVGGARLIAIETAPGERPEEVLRLAGSIEQASHHVVAAAIVEGALARGLTLEIPKNIRETMGSGLEGCVRAQSPRGLRSISLRRTPARGLGDPRLAACFVEVGPECFCVRRRPYDRSTVAGRRTEAGNAARGANAAPGRCIADCNGDRRSCGCRSDDRCRTGPRRGAGRACAFRQGRCRRHRATPPPHLDGRRWHQRCARPRSGACRHRHGVPRRQRVFRGR